MIQPRNCNQYVWRTMEWYRHEKSPNLPTTVLWQSCQQIYLVAKQEYLAKEIFFLRGMSFILRAPALLPFRRKSWYGLLSLIKIHRPWSGLNALTLGPMASTLTTNPPRTNWGYTRALIEPIRPVLFNHIKLSTNLCSLSRLFSYRQLVSEYSRQIFTGHCCLSVHESDL
jgi:hypothetical protein